MEKRLQLLLDAHRYQQVADEASRSGRSVAAVICEAIDVRFEQADAQVSRTAALAAFLDLGPDEDGPQEDVVTELHREFESHVSRKGGS